MGRIYWDEDQGGRPDPRAVDEAAIAAGVREATAATETRLAEGGRFFAEFGAAVVDGHAPVGQPGDIGSDPDSYGPDASDRG